jgi:transcriptional regulator with XRE-family HTH domain
MARKIVRPQPKKPRQPNYIRQWRNLRELSQERLAERVGTTHATISRIERGKQDYTQTLLESLAEALATDTASLLMRNPIDPDPIWKIWAEAKPVVRRQIIDVAKILLKTGT